MTGSGNTPSANVRAFVRWTLRNGRLLWALALILAVPSAIRTANLYRHLRSEVEQLLPREAPSVRALDEMRARSPGLHFLGVVAEVPDLADLPAAERFLDDLAARIRAYPPGMVRNVRSNRTAERAFVEKRAALYTDLADLKEIRRRVEARRDYEVAKEEGALLDEAEPPPPSTSRTSRRSTITRSRAKKATTSRAPRSGRRSSPWRREASRRGRSRIASCSIA